MAVSKKQKKILIIVLLILIGLLLLGVYMLRKHSEQIQDLFKAKVSSEVIEKQAELYEVVVAMSNPEVPRNVHLWMSEEKIILGNIVLGDLIPYRDLDNDKITKAFEDFSLICISNEMDNPECGYVDFTIYSYWGYIGIDYRCGFYYSEKDMPLDSVTGKYVDSDTKIYENYLMDDFLWYRTEKITDHWWFYEMQVNKIERQQERPFYQLDDRVSFEGFGEMDYALFVETDVGIGNIADYLKYGIYGDFTETVRDGENAYFLLNKKILGKKLSFSTHEEWDNYRGEYIVSVSPDLEWVISRQFNGYYGYHEKWYQNKTEVKSLDGNTQSDIRQYVPQKIDTGEYEAIPEQKHNELEQMLDNIYENYGVDKNFGERKEMWICFDEYGKLLAVRELKNEVGSIYDIHEENCIRIYDISKDQIEMLYELTLPEAEITWPIEISQIVGTEKEGWLVFSAGDTTYRMNYPSGDAEKIGEFMFGTTFSPDGRYLAYCTGSDELLDSHGHMYNEMRNRWDAIAPGWYVKDLETGSVAYIPIELWAYEDNRPSSLYNNRPRPLYGGRCVWIEKDKLFQILDR